MRIVAQYNLNEKVTWILYKNIKAFYYYLNGYETSSKWPVYCFTNAIHKQDDNLIVFDKGLWEEYKKTIIALNIIRMPGVRGKHFLK